MQEEVIAQEVEAHAALQKLEREEKAQLQKAGMTFHAAPNPAGYLKVAVDSAYERIVARLEKKGRDAAHVQKLRALFQE